MNQICKLNKVKSLTTKVKTKFSEYQTFSFRYGCLEKGFRFIKEENKFTDPDVIGRNEDY